MTTTTKKAPAKKKAAVKEVNVGSIAIPIERLARLVTAFAPLRPRYRDAKWAGIKIVADTKGRATAYATDNYIAVRADLGANVAVTPNLRCQLDFTPATVAAIAACAKSTPDIPPIKINVGRTGTFSLDDKWNGYGWHVAGSSQYLFAFGRTLDPYASLNDKLWDATPDGFDAVAYGVPVLTTLTRIGMAWIGRDQRRAWRITSTARIEQSRWELVASHGTLDAIVMPVKL